MVVPPLTGFRTTSVRVADPSARRVSRQLLSRTLAAQEARYPGASVPPRGRHRSGPGPPRLAPGRGVPISITRRRARMRTERIPALSAHVPLVLPTGSSSVMSGCAPRSSVAPLPSCISRGRSFSDVRSRGTFGERRLQRLDHQSLSAVCSVDFARERKEAVRDIVETDGLDWCPCATKSVRVPLTLGPQRVVLGRHDEGGRHAA